MIRLFPQTAHNAGVYLFAGFDARDPLNFTLGILVLREDAGRVTQMAMAQVSTRRLNINARHSYFYRMSEAF